MRNKDLKQIYDSFSMSEYIFFRNPGDAGRWGKQTFRDWRNGLTLTQEKALKRYKHCMCFAKHINMQKRHGITTSQANILESALLMGCLPENIIVSRNTCIDFLSSNGYSTIQSLVQDYEIGNPIRLVERGFMSTSLHNKRWQKLSKVRLIIKAPQGCHCGYIFTRSPFTAQERELLFAPGYSMAVEFVKVYNSSSHVLIVAKICAELPSRESSLSDSFSLTANQLLI